MFQWKILYLLEPIAVARSLIHFLTLSVAQEWQKKVDLHPDFALNDLKMDVYVCGYDCCFRTLNKIPFELKQRRLSRKRILLPAALALDRFAE